MISVVFPIYNQAHNIVKKVSLLQQFMGKHFQQYELILINDGSTDSSGEQIASLAAASNIHIISFLHNQGKGAAIRAGILASMGNYVIFTDADLPYHLSVITFIVERLRGGCDVAIGSRDLPQSVSLIYPSIGRPFLSYAFSFFANMVLLHHLGDTQCGVKGFRGTAGKNIFHQATIDGFCCDVEILLIAQRSNYTIERVPVTLVQNTQTTINFSAMIRMLYDVSKLIVSSSF